jgi:RNA polymerase sigma-70 factor (ECF subfamily)
MIDSDEHLVSRWITLADEAALTGLATRYLPQFYRTGRAMMLSHVQAEDIAQEAMLKVIRGLPSFAGASGFRVWSYTILLNTIRSEFGRGKRRNHVSLDTEGLRSTPIDSRLADPIDHSLKTELHAVFQATLAKLTDAQRTALILMHIDGLTAGEVAMLQECSVDAVYQRIAEAKRKLKNDPNLRSLWVESP